MGAGGEEGGYHAFGGRQAMGVLYKLPSMPDDEAHRRMERYVNQGKMDADLRFVREVYGLVNTNGRRDFGLFWESPWAEEHVRDTARKRKLGEQQRAMAVRTYIRRAADETAAAGASSGSKDEAGFLRTVDRLTSWEDRQSDVSDLVKTVSRWVQAYERATITHLLQVLDLPACSSMRGTCLSHLTTDDDDPDYGSSSGDNATRDDLLSVVVACTLRRSDRVFHLFAGAVAAEMVWGEATSGARNTTIYMCRQLDEKRLEACMALLRVLSRLPVSSGAGDSSTAPLPRDTLGMPLMRIKASFCVAKGVLVVMPGGRSATYVLDILGGDDDEDGLARMSGGNLVLDSGIKNIRILRVVEDNGST